MDLAWAHYDSSGNLNAASSAAFEIARTGQAWPDTPESNRLFRAWMAGICATVANLGPSPTRAASPTVGENVQLSRGAYVIEPKPSSLPASFDWQNMLVYGMVSLAWAGQGKAGGDPNDIKLSSPLGVATIDGLAPVLGAPSAVMIPGIGIVATAGYGDTGIIPAIPIVTGLVIVACVALLAGAAGWIASQVSEVSSIGIQQTGKTTAAVQAMTRAADIVDAHQAREEKEARDIPYDPQEIEVLKTLRETIKQTAGWDAPALRSVPDVADASRNIGKGLAFGEVVFLALAGYAAIRYASK
jgi:hypothetical protein